MNVVSFLSWRPSHRKWSTHYLDCLAAQAASCARFGARLIVITDRGAKLPGVETFGVDLPGELMPALLEGQRAYLASSAFDADTLLTGVDCLLGRDPDRVFDRDSALDDGWDVAVTIGPFADCPLNTGAIFCRAGTGPRLAAVWAQALAGMGTSWGDDQRALAAVLGDEPGDDRTLANGVRVRYLRCEEHNWAPRNERDPVDATVVHFRGPRKAWIRQWAKRFQ